ncbi:MAG TPA: TatD family deoxyribonuclease [Lentisphaerae bacterium]|nr:TatD family deoxyribonuclease [Lentisphaerota bacterium]
MLVDSHVHFAEFDPGDVPALLERAASAGVSGFVAVGGDERVNRVCLDLCRRYPAMVAAVGYDREQDPARVDLALLEEQLKDPACAAVGEIGLDYHYGLTRKQEQRRMFDRMLAIAWESRLPVVVHSREAEEDTLAALQPFAGRYREEHRLPGVLHCFTGSSAFMEKLVELGFLISFSGIVTFPNADEVRDTAAAVPEGSLLVETDAPLLAPQPVRGKRNEPAFLRYVAQSLAAVRRCTLEAIAEITTCNAVRLFGRRLVKNREAECGTGEPR